ncbi:hypothetical protein [Tunicatimonas pelagia]|uniref:hypothetical protein n=1 Tax=Tunicatimonas pelagia TaxID=931531 RepID=UPI002666B96F|nr:hypothetical protein [Tunicatimonas pelagia]WKN43076.1 hypothetical protein P0M28_28975 [Tunicatimonas pelagia]
MIDTQSDFLPFFFQEPVYVVNETQDETAYRPLGSNRCKILLLVEELQELHLSDSGKELLEKILLALELSFDDVCLVNVSQCETPDHLEGELDFKTCISFGMPPEPWQFSNFSRKYEIIRDESQRAFLWADPLAEVAADVEKKKMLWLSLKALFLSE